MPPPIAYVTAMPNEIPKRDVRRAEEDRLLDEAWEEAQRVGVVPIDEVMAWLRSLDTDAPLPRPMPRKM